MKRKYIALLSSLLLWVLLFPLPAPVLAQSENEFLYVNYFSNTYPSRGWEQHNGDYPFLDNSTSNIATRWSITYGWDDFDYYYGFENLENASLEILDVRLEFELQGEGNVYFLVNVWTDGYDNLTIVEKSDFGSIATGGKYLWFNQSVGDILNTRSRINNLRMEAWADIDSSNRWLYCRRARMNVTYREIWTDPAPPIAEYIPIGMGFFGLGALVLVPFYVILLMKREKKGDFWDKFPYLFALFFIAIGCVIAWLWS